MVINRALLQQVVGATASVARHDSDSESSFPASVISSYLSSRYFDSEAPGPVGYPD